MASEPRCPVCRTPHEGGACGDCVREVRDDLWAIVVLCGNLPAESRNRGVNGEAMVLLGPAADPEAWWHRATSAADGRIDPSYLEDNHGEPHPEWVVATWERVWAQHLGHDLYEAGSFREAAKYLDTQLSHMAGQKEPSFRKFAAEIHACRTHLEDVLRAGDREETGAPCPQCEASPSLVRRWEDKDVSGASDTWACPSCKSWWTEADYRMRVAGEYLANAPALTASQMHAQHGIPEGTLRSWASYGLVGKHGKDSAGRMLYDVEDALSRRIGYAEAEGAPGVSS